MFCSLFGEIYSFYYYISIYIVDDEPDGANDPQHYIIITSVYEPHVLQPLIDLGVAVDGIIKVKSETYMQNDEHTDSVEKDEQVCNFLLVSFICVAFLSTEGLHSLKPIRRGS